VNGAITQAGQTNFYTFNVANASLLYFDSLTNDGNLYWTLTGPRGSEVTARSFTGSDSANTSANPVLTLIAGNYTLSVVGNGDHKASYSFRLANLTSATPIVLGNPISGTLPSGNNTDLYQFTANAGDQVALNRQALESSFTPYWRLIDPYGDITYNASFGNSGTLTLLLSGTYTLLFEGQISANGALDYTFNVSSQGHVNISAPTGTALTLGALTSGSISTGGQQNNYVFTIGNPTNLYFDSQTNNSNLVWSLIGPQGTLISNRGFTVSDGYYANSQFGYAAVLNLIVPGAYQLRVQGSNGSVTGSYNFVLSDLASATPITPGTAVAGTLNPGNSTNIYRFSANAADLVYFDAQTLNGSSNTYWRLIDPYGRQVWFQSVADVSTEAIAFSGVYTLMVEGDIGNTSPVNYSFNVEDLTSATVPLTLGAQVNGTVTQTPVYSFSLANPTQLYFDSLTNNSNLTWSLVGPQGTLVSNRNFTTSDGYYANTQYGYIPVLNASAGSYTLFVAGNNGATNFSFRLSDLASATPITPGTAVAGTLNPGDSTNIYKFSANAADLVYFDAQTLSGSSNTYWRLIDPNGNQVWFASFADVSTQVLGFTGTYTLLVEGDIGNTSPVNYSFNVLDLTSTTVPLTLGAQVNGTVTQIPAYSFSLSNPALLYFNSLTNNSNLAWSLVGPQGTLVSNRNFTSSDGYYANTQYGYIPVVNASAGSYTLFVAGNNGATNFSFRLSDLASATPITPGIAVAGTLNPGNSTNIYKFSANAGDLAYFDAQTLSGSSNNYWRLIDPNGNQVWFSSFADVSTQALAFTGAYTLLVEGDVANTSPVNYSFNVEDLTSATVPLTLGAQVNGTLTQTPVYSFSLANPAQLYFDSLTNNSNLAWSLVGPQGTVVNNRNFTTSDGYYANIQYGYIPVVNASAGSYTLFVAGNNGATNFSFRLSDLASATPITAGTAVASTLNPGNSTNLYKFGANAGDRFYFDEQSISGSQYNTYWRLIDPNGNQIWFQYPFADVLTQAVPATGIYTLLVEGDIGNTSPVNYQFNVDYVPLHAPIQVTSLGLQPAPDLVVTNIAVTANGPVQSGGQVTVSWTDSNIGNLATAASWTDHVLVRNASNQVIATVLVPYDQTVSGPLAASGTSPRQATLRLPDGLAGAGSLSFYVTVDALNDIAEQSLSGQAELNNTSSLSVTSALAPYPDLQVTGLTVIPPDAWLPGNTVTINWSTTNAGSLATQSSWHEQVSVRDLSTGVTLVLATLPYDASTSGYGPLAPGASQARQYSFTWPSGLSSTGKYEFAITTNSENEIFEANAAGTATTNDTTLVDIASAPDLQVRNLMVTSSPVQSGATITLSWNDINTGVLATPAGWYDHIVVTNTTTGEQFVNTAVFYDPTQPGNGPLAAAGGSLARTFSFALPDGTRGAGALSITVTVNQNQNGTASLIEAADGIDATANNQASITVQSQEKPYPDLVASNFTIPASGNGGDQVQIGWTVTNSGTAATNVSQWVDRVILSTDATFGDADDVTLAEYTHTGALGPNQFYSASQTLTLPLQQDGKFYITVHTDASGAVIEPDTLANTYAPAAQISLTAPYSDLAVQAVVAPTSALSGGAINVTWRVANLGNSATNVSTWKDRIVLSTSNVYSSSSSIVLGDITHNGALAVGANYVGQASVQVPNGISGAYNVLVISDIAGQVYEKGLTQNNTGVSIAPIVVAPVPSANLAVTYVTFPSTAVPGVQQQVSWSIQNTGTGTARAPWVGNVYLSTDGTLSNVTYLATVPQNFDLPPGATYIGSAMVVLPDRADGNYKILVVPDANNQVYEPNRSATNNGTSPLALQHPDLVPSGVTLMPASLNSGDSTSVSWTVTDSGSGPALGSWTDTLYLSQGTAVGPNDLKLGDFVHTGPLAAGASYTAQANITLPLGASGPYHMLVVTNSTRSLDEVGATANNTAGAALQVALSPYADLAVSNVTVPTSVIGDPAVITVGWTVTNVGTGVGRTTSWNDEVILSLNTAPGGNGDIVLGEFAHNGALAAGASYTASQLIYLPVGLSNRYHVFVVSDPENVVFENGSKANNTAQAPNTLDVMPLPYADLVVSSVTTDPSAVSGGTLRVTWTVANQGIGVTNLATWSDIVTLVAANGTVVAGYSFAHLGTLAPGGGSYTTSQDLAVPNGISGIFHVVVSTGGPYEFSYTTNNSTTSAPLNIALAPSPDLVVSDIQVPQVATEGDFIDVSWTVSNKGQADASGTWVDQVVLTPVDHPELSPIPVGAFTHIGDLGPGLVYTRTERFQLPVHIQGVYSASVTTNANFDGEDGVLGPDSIYEYGAAATNNTTTNANALLVQLMPRPELQVADALVPTSVPAGGTASMSFTIINQGTVATTTPHWTDSVYLSLTDHVTGDSILVGTYDNGSALAPGQEYQTVTGLVNIPIRYGGDVYLIVVADSDGAVDEYPNQASSTRAFQFHVVPKPFADLVTSNVVAPDQVIAGAQVTVNYTVTNKGSGPTNTDTWNDQIWLTIDKTRPGPSDQGILLATVPHTGALNVGDGYDNSVQVTIPTKLANGSPIPSGVYFITAWTNAFGAVLQNELASNINPDDPHELYNDNYKARQVNLIGLQTQLPDLAVSGVIAPATAAADGPYTVSWTVTNLGADTGNTTWYDDVWLSDQPLLNALGAHQWQLDHFQETGGLAAGQSTTFTETYQLAPNLFGKYLIVDVNPHAALPEKTYDNNIGEANSLVTNAPSDLQMTAIKVPPQNYSGDPTTIQYTVTNFGAAVSSDTKYWTDAIWFSKDPVLNFGDPLISPIDASGTLEFLGTVTHSNASGLAAGASYTEAATVTLPRGIGGNFFIYVVTDADPTTGKPKGEITTGGPNQGSLDYYRTTVFEGTANNNNIGRADLPVTYREPDLVVSALALSQAGVSSGDTISVSWTVTDHGTRQTHEKQWTDSAFLARGPSLTPTDIDLGDFIHYGQLDVSSSYSQTEQIKLPESIQGSFYIIVYTDSPFRASVGGQLLNNITPFPGPGVASIDMVGDVPEFQGEGNNETAQPLSVSLRTPPDLLVSQNLGARACHRRAESRLQFHGDECRRRYPAAAIALDGFDLSLCRPEPRHQ
jgi:hypothetical protein